MKRRAVGPILVAVFVLTSANACPPGTSSTPGQKLLDLINQKRAAVGCAPVNGNEQLRQAAERHVVDTRDHPVIYSQPDPTKPNYRDPHIGTDGSTIDRRIADAGYTPTSRTGEIAYVALGPPDNNETANINWWMGSPTHKAIIENCAFKDVGVGLLYPGGTQWFSVVDFGAH
jgi:uncharacterized protein YkwD